MRPPSRWLAPGAGTAMPPPAPPSEGVARGPEGPPQSPPPTQAQERTEADQRNGGPTPPPKRPLQLRCGGTTAEAGAHTPCLLPADSGPATPRTAQTERPYQRPPRGRRGREPGRGGSPPLPPPLLPPHRPVSGRPDRARRPRPPGNPHGTSIPRGGTPGATEGRPTPDGAGGRGGRPPRPPTPAHPPAREPQERPSAPPEPRGRPPPPEGTATRGGGGCGWTCSRGGRGRGASPRQRAGATRATEQYGGRAPQDPPATTAHSGRAEGGFRSAGAPGAAVHGAPLNPPHPGAALRPRPHAHAGRECAEDTRGARIEYRRPPPRKGSREAAARPPPPTSPQAAGAPAPVPRGRGDGPPPARERSRSATRPPAPAAGSHGGRGEQASPRQRARTPHRSRPEEAGEHEPEWYGGPRPPWTAQRQ